MSDDETNDNIRYEVYEITIIEPRLRACNHCEGVEFVKDDINS